MEYRKLPHGDEMISVIGLGMGYMDGTDEEIAEAVGYAIDHGINFFDLVSSYRHSYKGYGMAFQGRRDKIYTQMHFGAVYETDDYAFTRDVDKIKKQVEWFFETLQTDYTDFGFLHCVDEEEDLDLIVKNGLYDLLLDYKKQGKVRHLGFGSHNPAVANKVLDLGGMDMMMFSINPSYDYGKGEYALGRTDERMELYRRCEREGVGISVMKPFGGGQLLDARQSLFKRALTKNQCIQYALDRPAVLTVLPGAANLEQVKELLKFTEATDAEKDYSVIGEFTPVDAEGTCVYCNHCQPCPKGILIGLVNKYYDLALQGDALAADHYHKLEKHASDCVSCGHCESRCPFHVKQETRMKQIREYFGE